MESSQSELFDEKKTVTKAIKQNLKVNQSQNTIEYFFLLFSSFFCYGIVESIKNMKFNIFLLFFLAEHDIETENRPLMTLRLFSLSTFNNLVY